MKSVVELLFPWKRILKAYYILIARRERNSMEKLNKGDINEIIN